MTDAKDRHSATLVNKIVSGLIKLKPPVYIDMGNHDYRDHKNPFFKFLNHIEGIRFITKPAVIKAGRRIAVIPHYRSQDEFSHAVDVCGHDFDSLLCHQTFDGAIAETGVRLTGLSASPIESLRLPLGVYAGDVHRPQTQGVVTYIGCPYHVRFGDNFDPRCIHVSREGEETYPRFEAPRKWSLDVRGPEDLAANKDLYEGDKIKLTICVPREEIVDWKKIKESVLGLCKEMKLDVHGCKLEVKTTKERKQQRTDEQHAAISPTATFNQFCKRENVASAFKKVGKEILDGNP